MKRLLKILCCLFFVSKVEAQDIHFSQFFTSPIALNPAKTGLFNGDIRLGANYKNQWNSIPVAYNTASVFADKSFGEKRNRMIKKSGLGILLAQDVAGDGNLSTTKIQFSGAFHQVLDYNEMYFLSGGLSVGVIQKHIDFNKLYWGNQWTGNNFNTQIDSKEPIRTSLITYPEINAGLEFSAILNSDQFLHGGFSMYHVNKSKETFFENDNHLGMKPVLNLGGSFSFDYTYELFTELYFGYQKKATEITLSAIGGYNLYHSSIHRTYIYAGILYRYKDAVIPIVGYAKNNVKIFINYDVNLSSLTYTTVARGGIEASIQYTYSKQKQFVKPVIPCSVF